VESPVKQDMQRLLTPSATAWHVEGVAMLILSGGFIGFLPAHYAALWTSSGRMRPLLRGTMRHSTAFCLVRRRSMKISRPLAFVMELMRAAPPPRVARTDKVRRSGNKL
jgi:hypothetical protein